MGTKRLKAVAVVVAVLVLGSALPVRVEALETGRGKLKRAKFLSEPSMVNHTGTTYEDLFTTGVKLRGDLPQCVNVQLSGNGQVLGGSGMPWIDLHLLVDGEVVGSNATVATTGWAHRSAFSHHWWACDLAAGGTRHTFQVQYKPYYGANTAYVDHATLTIEYRE